MRGWLHFWSFVVSIVSGACWSRSRGAASAAGAALATAVYSVTILGLFGVSALYHRHTWRTPRARAIMKRLDHSMIFLFIAGTYTPVAALAMDPGTARWVLTVVWGGALAGVVLKTVWPHAPSWLAVPIYMALGWVAVFVFPELLQNGGVAAFVLLLAGGALYTAAPCSTRRSGRTRGRARSATTSSSTRPRCSPRSATSSRSGWCCCARALSPPSGPLARRSSTFAMADRSSASQLVGVLADQPDRPGQRVGTRPGHARVHERVEHDPLAAAAGASSPAPRRR